MIGAGMVGGIIQGIGGIAQAASGIFGRNKRQKRLEALIAKRPKYQIPQELKDDLALTKNRVNARLDEQQDMKNALFTNAQNTVARAGASSGSVEDQLALAASSGAGMQDALIKNRMAGAQERAARLSQFREAGTNMAQAKDQAFKVNELDPYNMLVQGTMANDQMSREMTFGGINQLGAGLANAGSAGIAAGASGFFGQA